jgi:hypothetical protein
MMWDVPKRGAFNWRLRMTKLTPDDIEKVVETVWQIKNTQHVPLGKCVEVALEQHKLEPQWADIIWACVYM